ncbi:MAG: glycosyltransferase [Acidobacteria bacterium]|nr:glycosyltransferase [Acidobacteriota bacterium]
MNEKARKLRVLFFIDSVGVAAGTERYVSELVTRLDKTRFDLNLCCMESSPRLTELGSHCSTAVFPIESLYTLNGLRQIQRLRRYINTYAIDIVHTFMPKATMAGVLAAKGSRAAIVTSRRNMGYWATPMYRRVFRYLNRHTDVLLANSERVKQAVVETERVAPEKVVVLYNGVDLNQYGPGSGNPSLPDSLGVPRNAKVVGIVANYRPVKNLKLFLRAAAIVSARVPQAVFLLVGQGPLQAELARTASELGITNKVFFSDGKGAVADYLGRMCIGCLSSESEGFSNALLEYMASGLPVVATDVGGNAEAISHEVNGYLVASVDPESFAAPIIGLLMDEAKRIAMGHRSLERCRANFEIGAAVRRQEEFYTALLESRRRQP